MAKVPGSYKQSLQGYRTFAPDPLPPRLALTPAVQREIEEATHLLGRVEMCRTLLPNVDLLIYSSLRREALASSTIEGTIATADELVRYQVSHSSEREAVREVANYTFALEWGCLQLPTRPLALGLILGLHERLLHGVRGASSVGRLKDTQNRIGRRHDEPIEQAIFMPPAPEDTLEHITALERYINNPANREARVAQCALAHYQFETIHPFNDGNGRVGRLLIILHMMQLGLLSAPMIYPSVYFERTRDEYYKRLQDVRERGSWNAWIGFFARGIQQQCHETIAFTQLILRLRQHLQVEIANVRRRATLGAVLDAFFNTPVLSTTEIAAQAHISYNAAQAALLEMQQQGIVREMSGKQKRRVYGCTPVLDAIFGVMPAPSEDAVPHSAENA